MRIGIISDTYQPSDQKTLWPEVYTVFKGVDLILHCGNIVQPIVLDWLEEIAPTMASRGRRDWPDARIQDVVILEREGLRLAMRHDMESEELPIQALLDEYWEGERYDILVTGDTHRERLDYRDGVLQINPGSATHPHVWTTRLGTVGLMEIRSERIVEARTVRLGQSEGLRNPGVEYRYTPETGVVVLG